jgi:hypothetical protein
MVCRIAWLQPTIFLRAVTERADTNSMTNCKAYNSRITGVVAVVNKIQYTPTNLIKYWNTARHHTEKIAAKIIRGSKMPFSM